MHLNLSDLRWEYTKVSPTLLMPMTTFFVVEKAPKKATDGALGTRSIGLEHVALGRYPLAEETRVP